MSRSMKRQLLCSVWAISILVVLTLGATAVKAQESLDLVIRNDYIAIVVNNSEENTGRFSLETTGGDPTRSDDDNQPLLFKQGGRQPRTSYTTVRIDGEDYVFGGKTTDRAGFSGQYGTMVQRPTIVEEDGQQHIVAAWMLQDILVTQYLRFARSSTTGLYDTAEIAYTVENTSNEAREVGFRIMLDTMLGENDGAPFRVGEEAVLTDQMYEDEGIPDFWQAFDSLTDPRVIGQGTLRGPDIETPDRVYLTNWGAVADGLWDFSFEPGRDFTRLGEFDLDSAMALYWDPIVLEPGETKQYVTHYGLGGISIVRGNLSLGITSPASIDAAREKEFPVIVYVQNTGEGDALDVNVRICVPNGLTLPGNQSCATRSVGDLPLGREAQVSWDVALDGAVGGELEYTVEASAENLPETVRVSRTIDILGPPKLFIQVEAPQEQIQGIFNRWNPPKQPIVATVTNDGATAAQDVVLSLNAPVGMELSAVDRTTRLIGELRPGDSRSVTWHAALLGYSGNLPFTVTAEDRASDVSPVTKTEFLDMLFLPRAFLSLPHKGTKDEPARIGDVVAVDVFGVNLWRLRDVTVEIQYDPQYVQLVTGPPGLYGAYRGDLFILDDNEKESLENSADHVLPWTLRALPEEDGLARVRIEASRGEADTLPVASGSVGSLRFRTLRPGETELVLKTFRDETSAESSTQQNEASTIERNNVTLHVLP